MDVVILGNDEVQIIELNPFGSEMSSGAGLFNWKTDRELLYGEKNQDKPHIRVLTKLLEDDNKS